MKTIWKFKLLPYTRLEIQKGAKLLKIAVQNDEPFMWFLLDPSVTEKEILHCTSYGTGHNVPDDPGEYLGTFMVAGGALVFHVFGRKE